MAGRGPAAEHSSMNRTTLAEDGQRAPSLASYGGDPYDHDPAVQAANTPLWREALFGFDWLALRASPVYWGYGVERGHGEPVVVVPGFMGSDSYLCEMYAWLARIGYRPYFSGIGRNADCPDHLAAELLKTVRAAHEETGKRVRVVGHSLGGLLARSVALDHPELVATVIALGSPFRDAARAHPTVIAATAALRREGVGQPGSNLKPSCFSGHCTCRFVRNMLSDGQLKTQFFAVYSKNDGVVDWRSCLDEDEALNDEVNSTHIGMAFHPGAYRAIAKRLAQRAEAVEPEEETRGELAQAA
jgi:triacylglycerol lipase